MKLAITSGCSSALYTSDTNTRGPDYILLSWQVFPSSVITAVHLFISHQSRVLKLGAMLATCTTAALSKENTQDDSPAQAVCLRAAATDPAKNTDITHEMLFTELLDRRNILTLLYKY